MDFGKVADIAGIDFSLPEDHPETPNLLDKICDPSIKPQVYLGLPTWKEQCFLGKIYPSHAKEPDYLKHYARQFNTIELNSTYYGIPRITTVEKWRQLVPDGFRFCPKVSSNITHEQKLQNAQTSTTEYCQAMRPFAETLGLALLLLPLDFGPEKMSVLENYVSSFPKDIPLSVEFRDPKWFSDPLTTHNVFKMLEYYKISPVITDTPGRRDVLHQRLTTAKVMVRFVGNALHATDYERIDDWCYRLKSWFAKGLQEVYFFIHLAERDLAVDLVLYMVDQLQQICGITVQKPKLIQEDVQQTFF